MSKSKRKQEQSKQTAAILFDENSERPPGTPQGQAARFQRKAEEISGYLYSIQFQEGYHGIEGWYHFRRQLIQDLRKITRESLKDCPDFGELPPLGDDGYVKALQRLLGYCDHAAEVLLRIEKPRPKEGTSPNIVLPWKALKEGKLPSKIFAALQSSGEVDLSEDTNPSARIVAFKERLYSLNDKHPDSCLSELAVSIKLSKVKDKSGIYCIPEDVRSRLMKEPAKPSNKSKKSKR